MSYEIIQDEIDWTLVNKTTGVVVVQGVPHSKAVEIKRNLEANREKRANSMNGGL